MKVTFHFIDIDKVYYCDYLRVRKDYVLFYIKGYSHNIFEYDFPTNNLIYYGKVEPLDMPQVFKGVLYFEVEHD